MNLKAHEVRQHLEHIRSTQGDEAYEKARLDFAHTLVLAEGGRAFLSNALQFKQEELDDIERAARAELAKKSPEAAMAEMLKMQLPNCKTQAQFNVFMAGFEALRACLDATFAGNKAGADKARALLVKVIDQAEQVTRAAEQLREVPEAAPQGERAADLTEEPIEFHEHDQSRQLMAEVMAIQTRSALDEWYHKNQPRLRRIVDRTLRNEVYDAIRRKKSDLTRVQGNDPN